MSLTLRPATMDDATILLHWRNDPETRAMSSDTSEIATEDHMAWLAKRGKGRRDLGAIFIAKLDGTPIGTGRIDRKWDALALKMDSCLLGYSLDPGWRGQGYGKQLVSALVREAQLMGYGSVGCRIKRNNVKSLLCAVNGGVNHIELF